MRRRSIATAALRASRPGDANYKVDVDDTFREDVELLALLPHMHLRGKSFEYEAVYPDGKEEVLLSVPRYDFGWQSDYRLAKPLRPAGGDADRLHRLLRQLGQEPQQPRPDEGRALGRSDLGGDDDRLHRLRLHAEEMTDRHGP